MNIQSNINTIQFMFHSVYAILFQLAYSHMYIHFSKSLFNSNTKEYFLSLQTQCLLITLYAVQFLLSNQSC